MSHDVRFQYDTIERPDQPAGEPHPHVDAPPAVGALLAERHGLPWRRCILSVLLMALVLSVAVAAGLYWRLGKGPMSTPFLVDHALLAIGTKLPPGYGVGLGDVALARRGDGLAIEFDDLSLRDTSGAVLAAAPRVDVAVDPWSLLTGRVEPRSIVIDGASAAASIDKNGQIGFRAGEASMASGAPAELSVAAMMDALDALLAAAGTLDKVELRNATLVVHDRAFGRESVHPNIGMTVRRTAAPGGLAFSVAAGGGSVDATIEGRGEGARQIDVKARGISLQQIAANIAPGAKPLDLAATIDAVIRAHVAADGTIDQGSLDVASPGGSWRVEPDVRPFIFDRAGVSMRWDGAAKQLIVDKAMLSVGDGIGNFTGVMTPPKDGETDWMIALEAPGMTIAGPVEGDVPLKLDTATVRGRYNSATRVLGIDRAEFGGPTGGLALAGSISFNGQTPGIGLGLAADRMSVAAVKRFWPFFAVAPAREWFAEHAIGGILEKGTLSLAIAQDALVAVNGVVPPLPDSAVKGEMSFSQSSVSIVDTLPPVTGIDAHSEFSARRFGLTVGSGTVDLGEAGALDLTDGSYEIADLVPKPAMQHVEFDLGGPAQAVATLMTHEPLAKAAEGVKLKPQDVAGKAQLHVSVDFPTLPKPKESDFSYRLSGDLTEFSVADFEGQTLEKGALKIAVEPGVVLLTGKANVAGLPAHIDYRKADSNPPQVSMTATLDDAARKKRGLDFGDGLDGPVTAEIRVAQTATGPRYGVDVDLSAARVRDLLPGWQKAPGRPGKASFIWIPKGEGGTIEDFALDSGAIGLHGDITLGPDGKFRKAIFNSIRFASGDDAAGTVEAAGEGWKVGVRGKALDLRPILTMLQKRGAASSKGDLAVDVELDRATGFGDEVLAGFDFSVDIKSQTVRRFSLKGSFGSQGITGGMRNSGNGSAEIYVETVDAGSLLRFLDYYTHVDGGILQAALTPRLDSTGGQIFIRDFRVSNESALGQYRTSLQRSGRSDNDAIQSGPQDSDSARFDKLRLTFERSADRLSIAEAVVWGPEIGANLSGTIDYAADRVSLTGTFVPAYSLNNLFSQIPVLGMILGGGQHEGLFAITFKVSGAASSPTLSVNPLSAIAPGFLRKLFDFQKDGG